MPSVNITFYQFEKRSNSTLQPTGEGELFQCQIFDPCSMISPKIKLSFPSGAGNPTLWNYAYIGDFTRYYFVRDWTWENGLWVADLVEDCLTSWKNYIYNSTQYVLRAASTFNPTVVDTVFPAASQPGYEIVTGANPWTDNINNGTFVLSVIGSGVQGFGAASYYSLSNVAFNSLRSALLSNIDYLNISTDEISQELSKALFNPYQYIVSATWFPRAGMFQNAGMVTSSIATGWWDMSISGSAYFIDESSDTYTIYQTFRLPKHPQASERGRWLNAPPYMSYTLYMPPFGEIVLDGAILVTASEIFTTIVIDAYTGLAHLYVSLDDPAGGMPGNIISTTSAQVGVTVPLAQIAYNPIEAADNIVPLAVAGAVQGLFSIGGSAEINTDNVFQNVQNALVAMGSGVANGIGDALSHKYSTVQYKGAPGTVSTYKGNTYLAARYFQLVADNNEDFGRPLCTRRQLGTLRGFVQCADADIALPATAQEIEAVKKALINGFFME